ncbi:TonB-dependent receptor [Sphingomonas sp. G-3-2-10]|uniref:TonB-dependent receptor plug domain-containing protein n=1 Tax=Sphingomonas sp. G-3-2-10 TaxID=2728838 RepID=UPI00146B9F9A|nr:TonB-dependent receptor [Sphingomonas sp. G-3-2-10]NML08165.1 TonB-dependent receptor [Sphingomonas sp. G-3-2-10]
MTTRTIFSQRTLRLGTSLAALLACTPALAQEVAAEPEAVQEEPAQPASNEEIVVTATRAGTGGFRAPTPTTVVGSAAIEQRQSITVADVLQEIPAFKPTISPGANGVRTQLPGANLADLRGLGSNRTLVLVDGARVTPQAPANNTGTGVSPDLNQIPALLVERAEVITGGASAQWGSDAVAGVVNIILRKKYSGFQLTAQTGFSTYGDGLTKRIGALGGVSLMDDRLHIVAALDFSESDKVGDIYTRPWGAREYQIVANSAASTNGLPVNLIVPNVHFYSSPNMLITGPAGFSLRNYEFHSNGGAPTPFVTGSIVSGTAMIGGQGQSQAKGLSLVPGIRRFDPYARVQFDISDDTNIWLVGSYSMLRTEMNPLPSRITGGTIRSDNAYLQSLYPSIAASLGANGSFTFNRVNYDFAASGENGPAIVENKTPHIAFGAEGRFSEKWKWDLHFGWGKNIYTNSTAGNGIRSRITYATDAVFSGGQIVCRALVPGSSTYNPTAAAGCVPINLFGQGSPSAAAISYVTGTAQARSVYEQRTAAANIRGELFETWAGPISIGAGVEYRREEQTVTADSISAAGGFEIANAGPFHGKFDVTEGYVEAIVPLLKDSAIGRSFDLNGAIRVANYSTVGTQTTWKVGASYEPVDGVRFRATRSRDIRAPALFELYSPGSIANNSVSVRNPANSTTYTANIPVNLSIGNANLDAEKAETYTIGVVLEPRFLPNFKVSVDYYDIDLKQAITTLPATSIASLCNAGDLYYCSAFTFSAAGPPTALSLGAQNLAGVHVQGFDAQLAYRFPLSGISLPGRIEMTVNGTYTQHVIVNTGTGAAPIDRAGENSTLNTYSTPRTRINGSLTYRVGGFALTSQMNFISAGTVDNTFNTSATTTANINHVPAYAYLNLYADMTVNDNFAFFGSVRNVFNTAPPPLPSSTLNIATNGQYYDTLGTFFQAGFRVKF